MKNLSNVRTEDLLEELETRISIQGEEIPFKGNTGIIYFAFRTLQLINDGINSKVVTMLPSLDQAVRSAIKNIKLAKVLD